MKTNEHQTGIRARLSRLLFALTFAFAIGCGMPGQYRPPDSQWHTDVLTENLRTYFDWSGRVAPEHIGFLLRCLLLYGLPCLFSGWAFARGNRSVAIQAMCAATGLLLAATIPADHVTITNKFVRGWFIFLSVVLLAFLPALLPKLVIPQLGPQRKLQVIGYLVLVGLFISEVFQ